MQEILVILVLALIFLGPKKLPELASGIGKAIREVRKATADIKSEIELDDVIRKPLEELREATMLPPEELKRRDEERKWREQREKEEKAARDRGEDPYAAKASDDQRRPPRGRRRVRRGAPGRSYDHSYEDPQSHAPEGASSGSSPTTGTAGDTNELTTDELTVRELSPVTPVPPPAARRADPLGHPAAAAARPQAVAGTASGPTTASSGPARVPTKPGLPVTPSATAPKP